MLLYTPSGQYYVSPTGIYSDYGNEFGAAAIDKNLWSQWTLNNRPTNTSLYLKEPTKTNEIRDLVNRAGRFVGHLLQPYVATHPGMPCGQEPPF